MKTEIYLGKVNVTSVQNNAVLNYGESSFLKWVTRSKVNSALSRVSGDGNVFESRLNLVNDPDLFDVIIKTPK